MHTNSKLTLENILLQLRQFLALWVSQIVHHNHIYPDAAFEKRKYLDLVVHQSRAPALNSHIEHFCNDVVSLLVKKNGGGKIHQVVVLVFNEKSLHVTKRYILDFSQFVGLADQVLSMDFLRGNSESASARVDVPELTWNSIYTHFRSLMFFHVEELKRTSEPEKNDLFYKFLLNVDGAVDLSSETGQWAKLISDDDPRRTKLVPLGEIALGFLCLEMHNEYVTESKQV